MHPDPVPDTAAPGGQVGAAGAPDDGDVRRWSLEHLVHLLVVVLVGLLVLTAAATAYGREDVAVAEQALRTRVGPAQMEAATLTKAYVDQETGQRGYLLSGDARTLAPYVAGQQQATRARAELGRLLASDQTSTRLLAQVDAASRAWTARAAEPEIAARRQAPLTQAELRSAVTAGRPLFDDLRTRLSALQARTAALSAAQVQRIGAAQRLANLTAACAVALALAVAVLTAVLLRRYLTGPLERLLRQLRGVSEGRYGRPIATTDGPQELAAIGEAVERMRQELLLNGERLAQARQQMTLLDERDRIAGDLHDLTIQRVFALGLMLQSTALRRPGLASDLEPLVDETDRIIRELRGVIFGITHDRETADLRDQVSLIVAESRRSLSFTPDLQFRGPVEQVPWERLAPDALATLREALSNVAKHAQATAVQVRVAAAEGHLCLTVSDNGVGLGPGGPQGNGLRNFRRRAERWGGTCAVTSVEGHGTTVEWRVPTVTHDDRAAVQDAG